MQRSINSLFPLVRGNNSMLLSNLRPASALALSPSLVFSLIRVVARAMVALISGGPAIISCILTIVQGALWMQVAEAPQFFLTTETLARRGRTACCGTRCGGGGLKGVPQSLRACALAALIFAVLEGTTWFAVFFARAVNYGAAPVYGVNGIWALYALGNTLFVTITMGIWAVISLHWVGRFCDAAMPVASEASALLKTAPSAPRTGAADVDADPLTTAL